VFVFLTIRVAQNYPLPAIRKYRVNLIWAYIRSEDRRSRDRVSVMFSAFARASSLIVFQAPRPRWRYCSDLPQYCKHTSDGQKILLNSNTTAKLFAQVRSSHFSRSVSLVYDVIIIINIGTRVFVQRLFIMKLAPSDVNRCGARRRFRRRPGCPSAHTAKSPMRGGDGGVVGSGWWTVVSECRTGGAAETQLFALSN